MSDSEASGTMILPPPDENWDKENCGTYDPNEHAEKRIVLRCLIKAPKSKKKQFKLAERARIQNLLQQKTPLDEMEKLKINDDKDVRKELTRDYGCKSASEEEVRTKFTELKLNEVAAKNHSPGKNIEPGFTTVRYRKFRK